jgi:hypothetical protein
MRKLLFALLALAGCADNGTDMTPPGGDGGGAGSGSGSGSGGGGGGSEVDVARDYDDVATSLGANLAAGDLVAMVDSINMAYGRMPAGFTVSQGSDYLLVDGVRGNLQVEYKLYCRDDLDLYTSCDGFENHAHVKPTITGDLGGSTSMAGVDRTGAWIVRDLTLATPRIGGEGNVAFATHLQTGDYDLTIADNLNHVIFDATPGAPISGSVDLTVNVVRTRASAEPVQRTFDVVASIAFDGSDNAVLTLDDLHHYNLSITSGAVIEID